MDSPWRLCWLALGWALIVLSPAVGILPGPGGIFVFVGGVILLLRNSHWAKRRYVQMKRRWPRLGQACDKVMGRASHKRRMARMAAAIAGD